MSTDVMIEYGGAALFGDQNSILVIVRGSRVVFHPTSLGYRSEVRGLSSSVFDSAANVSGEYGSGDTVRYVKTNAPLGTHTISLYTVGDKKVKTTLKIKVISAYNPGVPSVFNSNGDFKTSYTDLQPNEQVTIPMTQQLITVGYEYSAHIKSDDPNTLFYVYIVPDRNHGSPYRGVAAPEIFARQRSNTTMYLVVQYTAPPVPYATKVVNITVGNRFSYKVTLKTGKEVVPAKHLPIYMGKGTGNISLRDIIVFFGGSNSLSDYRRGQLNVPDMPANSGIPTSLPLRVTQYRNAATAFYVNRHPNNSADEISTLNGAKSAGATWQIWSKGLNHWDLGFSNFIKNSAEFRYTVSHEYHKGYGSGRASAIKLWSPTGNAGSWSTANRQVNLTVEAPNRSEFLIWVTVTFYARHIRFPDKVVTTTARYTLTVTGV